MQSSDVLAQAIVVPASRPATTASDHRPVVADVALP
jgi:hypothetical protein